MDDIQHKPSLLEQFNSLDKKLNGFTLGFYKFFDNFKYNIDNSYYSLNWNSILFARSGVFKSGGSTHYCNTYPTSNNVNRMHIQELIDFIEAQKQWVQTEESQKAFQKNKRLFREECQKRINFFVNALHQIFSGVNMNKPPSYTATFDPYLRDIRNLAFLALKD